MLENIYIKNLNAEGEDDMSSQALVRANKALYQRTCEAIREAAKTFMIQGEISFHVFSNKRNPKIPQADLHEALKSGGANTINADPARYEYEVSKNDNSQKPDQPPLFTHHHVAIINLDF